MYENVKDIRLVARTVIEDEDGQIRPWAGAMDGSPSANSLYLSIDGREMWVWDFAPDDPTPFRIAENFDAALSPLLDMLAHMGPVERIREHLMNKEKNDD